MLQTLSTCCDLTCCYEILKWILLCERELVVSTHLDLIQVFFLGISHLANAEDRCVRKCRCVKIACKRIATSALFYAIQTKHYF